MRRGGNDALHGMEIAAEGFDESARAQRVRFRVEDRTIFRPELRDADFGGPPSRENERTDDERDRERRTDDGCAQASKAPRRRVGQERRGNPGCRRLARLRGHSVFGVPAVRVRSSTKRSISLMNSSSILGPPMRRYGSPFL